MSPEIDPHFRDEFLQLQTTEYLYSMLRWEAPRSSEAVKTAVSEWRKSKLPSGETVESCIARSRSEAGGADPSLLHALRPFGLGLNATFWGVPDEPRLRLQRQIGTQQPLGITDHLVVYCDPKWPGLAFADAYPPPEPARFACLGPVPDEARKHLLPLEIRFLRYPRNKEEFLQEMGHLWRVLEGHIPRVKAPPRAPWNRAWIIPRLRYLAAWRLHTQGVPWKDIVRTAKPGDKGGNAARILTQGARKVAREFGLLER